MEKICKQCGLMKSFSEYYSHPKTKDGFLGRCKECIKEGRKTEREREMARIVDRKRKRPKGYVFEQTKKYRISQKHKYLVHGKVNNFLRYHKKEYDFVCAYCGQKENIELHHEDYSKPNEVIPLCSLHHSQYHYGKIKIDLNSKIILPFE